MPDYHDEVTRLAEDQAPPERRVRRGRSHRPGARAPYDLQQRPLPEPGRVLESAHGYFHDLGRHMYSLVQVLRDSYGEAVTARSGRAAEARPFHIAYGTETLRGHVGGPR